VDDTILNAAAAASGLLRDERDDKAITTRALP
jgi:hypothetical protein